MRHMENRTPVRSQLALDEAGEKSTTGKNTSLLQIGWSLGTRRRTAGRKEIETARKLLKRIDYVDQF